MTDDIEDNGLSFAEIYVLKGVNRKPYYCPSIPCLAPGSCIHRPESEFGGGVTHIAPSPVDNQTYVTASRAWAIANNKPAEQNQDLIEMLADAVVRILLVQAISAPRSH